MKILVVDNNAISRRLLRATLRSGGHEIVDAADGVDALEKLRSEKFDAVICDILMPRMDGYRFCYEVRRDPKLRDLPMVIYSSTYTSPGDEQLAMTSGADRFLRKPASPAVLLETIEELSRVQRPQRVAPHIDMELEVLKEYSERLVQKLEDKNLALEAAKEQLQDANSRLSESEVRLRLLLESTAEAIYGLDLEGNFTFCNPACVTMLGYERAEDLLGGHAHTLIHHTRAGGAPNPVQDCGIYRTLQEDRGNHSDDDLLWRADGTSFPAEYWSYPLRKNGKLVGAVVTFLDITERKRAEESIQKLSQAVEQADDAIYMTDPAGTITYVNPAFEKIYGYSREEALGRTPRILKSGRHDRAFYKRFWQKLLAGDSVREEFVNKRRDGQLVTVEASVSPVFNAQGTRIGFIAVQDDVTERKQGEEALRHSEERYRSLIESSRDVITVIDPHGTIRFASPSVERVAGYQPDELAGQNAFSFVHPEDAARLKARLAEILTRETATVPISFRFRHKDGTWRVFESVGNSRLADPQVGGVVLNSRDVTEIRQAEEALRASEERYRLLFETNPQPLWVFDEETLAFLAVNEAACRHYGYSRQEFLGMTIKGIRPPEDAPALLDQIAGETQDYEQAGIWRHRKKDGTVIQVEITSHRLLFDGHNAQLVLAADVTDRRRVELALRGSEERYRLLFERNLAGVFRSTLAGQLLDCNDAFARIYGYASRREILARPASDLYTDAELRQPIMERIRREKELVNYEEQGRRKDGSSVWVLGNYTLVTDTKGDEGILEGTIVDITERRQLQEQLQQAQKMEAIGQLAGGVAHDFNNLLTAILGYSDLLATEVGEQSPFLESIDEIRKAGERAAGLTRQLLAFSRRQVLEPKVLDLNALVVNLEKMLRRLIGEDVRLSTVLDPGIGHVRADAGQIEQVILNLAVNARDAMPKGGTLTIETRDMELDEAYADEHATVRPGSYVMFAVTDTGTGMSSETKSHMFEPFFTTKGKGKGTGLGLATVYGIVKQSGGWIWVYSELGRGTTFKIYLPRVEGAVEEKGQRRPARPSVRGTETVLLVEDEQSVRTLTRTVLQASGYTVLEAGGAEDALETVRQHPGPIHLLLTDVVMPDMGGSALASQIGAIRPGIKVLYMSGYTDDAVVRHGLVGEGMSFLQKPFTPDSLAAKVRAVLDVGELK